MHKHDKRDELLLRVFKLISDSHFGDHKMNNHYCRSIHFDRSLGDDISNYMQGTNPEYYHKKRKEFDRYIKALREEREEEVEKGV